MSRISSSKIIDLYVSEACRWPFRIIANWQWRSLTCYRRWHKIVKLSNRMKTTLTSLGFWKHKRWNITSVEIFVLHTCAEFVPSTANLAAFCSYPLCVCACVCSRRWLNWPLTYSLLFLQLLHHFECLTHPPPPLPPFVHTRAHMLVPAHFSIAEGLPFNSLPFVYTYLQSMYLCF